MSQPASDARFAAGVRLFNHENFFEAHDVWEQVWKNVEGEEKTFYQGLIQAAAFASRSTRQFCGRYFRLSQISSKTGSGSCGLDGSRAGAVALRVGAVI
jgi:uncharacterized protein